MEENTKKFASPTFTCLSGRLVKDPEVKVLEARDDKPAKPLVKFTVVDSASSDYYQDVFVESTFAITNPNHPLLKLRKGDFLETRGKIEYRPYLDKEGKPKVAGEMRYPRDFVLAPGEWSDREPLALETTGEGASAPVDTKTPGKAKASKGAAKLPW